MTDPLAHRLPQTDRLYCRYRAFQESADALDRLMLTPREHVAMWSAIEKEVQARRQRWEKAGGTKPCEQL